MNLNNKLNNLPHVYYINLDNRTDRKNYMESQFDYWNIKRFTRVSGTKYLASEANKWKHLIVGDVYMDGERPHVTANAMTCIEMINSWLENTDDSYMIIMEDDVDLNLIEYWHFDFDYLMANIPYDWDCIQFSYTSGIEVKFFLHPLPSTRSFNGPCMINRRYAQKLIDLHFKDNKFIFKHKVNDYEYVLEGGNATIDYFLSHNGRTYCLPLLSVNNDFGSCEWNVPRPNPFSFACRDLYYDFWINGRDKFTLEDFFTYGKPNDHLMTRTVDLKNYIN